jgi:hypothetical protein
MRADHGRHIKEQLGGRSQASGLFCPECEGGSGKERSVSAWWDGITLKAKCWRNKCSFSYGWLDTDQMGAGFRTRAPERRIFHVNTLPLDAPTGAYVEDRYHLLAATLQHWGLRQTAGGTAVYAPVMSPKGYSRGVVRRWIKGRPDGVPKVQGFPSTGHGAWLAWFPTRPGGLVVAVEDVFSALRLWQAGINAVSLLGTSLTPTKMAELRRNAGVIVLVLDADAVSSAIDSAVRYSIHVRALWSRDIKDMTEEQLATWIDSLTSSLPASSPDKLTTS